MNRPKSRSISDLSDAERKQVNRDAAKVYRKRKKEEMLKLKERITFLRRSNEQLKDSYDTITNATQESHSEHDPRTTFFKNLAAPSNQGPVIFPIQSQRYGDISDRHARQFLELLQTHKFKLASAFLIMQDLSHSVTTLR